MVAGYIDWEGCQRLNADNDDVGLRVRVHFKAGGWYPYSAATWTQPAEGGFFQDITFVRAEIDPRDLPCEPLSEAEIAAARAWFETDEANDYAQSVSIQNERDLCDY